MGGKANCSGSYFGVSLGGLCWKKGGLKGWGSWARGAHEPFSQVVRGRYVLAYEG